MGTEVKIHLGRFLFISCALIGSIILGGTIMSGMLKFVTWAFLS